MARRMPHLMQVPGSSQFYYRSRVPKQILQREACLETIIELPAIDDCPSRFVVLKLQQHVKLSLRTSRRSTAERLAQFIDSQLAERYALALRPPAPISNMKLAALAGVIYQKFVDRFLENPGSRADWVALKAFNRAAREGRLLNPPSIQPFEVPSDMEAARQIFGVNLSDAINALEPTTSVAGLESRFGLLTDWVLETHGFRIDPESRLTLLRRVEEATTFAALRMKRAADGDYSPDPEALRYPKLVIDDKVTIDDLYDRWVRESSPSPSTLSSWKKPLNLFKAHIGDIAVDALEPRHIVSWKDKLLGAGLDTRTINSTYLAAVRRWLQIGVDNQLLQTNAAKGILVAVSNQTSSQRRAYSDAEIARLLLSSIAAGDKIRWLIWLAVGTGARIGELAQLWGSSFRQIGGDWYVDISAAKDGGRLKNDGSERTIPLHGHLVSSGLPGYIAARGQGPLFYKRSSGNPNKKHASKGVANRTSAWVRDQGFAGSDLAPCHSIRHWWKTTAHRHGVLPVDADVFQGHSIQGVAHIYRHIAPEDLLRVVAAMPFPAPATSIAPADIG